MKHVATFPYPPSVNNYWILISSKGGGRKVLGKKGKEFREAVIEMSSSINFEDSRLSVQIDAFPPDRRKRDLDNILKPLLDALESAGMFNDDSQIDTLSITRKEVLKGGAVTVTIETLGGE